MLFVPAEAFLAAALEADPGLLEYAAARQVVLATPTTLIALLRTVAHGWSHEALADQAREIHRLGRELHERLARWAATSTRSAARSTRPSGTTTRPSGSLESRVLVSARQFAELGSPTTSCRRRARSRAPPVGRHADRSVRAARRDAAQVPSAAPTSTPATRFVRRARPGR